MAYDPRQARSPDGKWAGRRLHPGVAAALTTGTAILSAAAGVAVHHALTSRPATPAPAARLALPRGTATPAPHWINTREQRARVAHKDPFAGPWPTSV